MSDATTLPFPGISLDAGDPPGPGPIRLGSDDHKNLFCRTLLTTFDPYKPAVIDWPKLDKETETKITGLPIWDIAVQTEGKAGLRVATFGELVRDPLLKRAIELDAFEERRHKHVLHNMVEAYGIKLEPEPDYIKPKDPEWAFMVTGYSECIDSFFAFGLFDLAKRSGFFPPELVDTFEPVMQRGRPPHPVFRELGGLVPPQHAACGAGPGSRSRSAAVWAFLIWERIGIASDRRRRRAAGQQFHRQRRAGTGRGDHHSRIDGHLSCRKRPAAGCL